MGKRNVKDKREKERERHPPRRMTERIKHSEAVFPAKAHTNTRAPP